MRSCFYLHCAVWLAEHPTLQSRNKTLSLNSLPELKLLACEQFSQELDSQLRSVTPASLLVSLKLSRTLVLQ